MIDANKMITVTLSMGAMNIVMGALYKLPYEVVVPIVDDLKRQITEIEPGAFGLAVANAPRVNGEDAVRD